MVRMAYVAPTLGVAHRLERDQPPQHRADDGDRDERVDVARERHEREEDQAGDEALDAEGAEARGRLNATCASRYSAAPPTSAVAVSQCSGSPTWASVLFIPSATRTMAATIGRCR